MIIDKSKKHIVSTSALSSPAPGQQSEGMSGMSHSNSVGNNLSNAGISASTNHEVIYEMTVVEAAITVFAAVEFNCPEALIYEEDCLINLVNSLELAYRILIERYSITPFRQHSRYKHLLAILLECFSWLPPGSFPHSVRSIYEEAFHVFQDCTASLYETSLLSKFSDLQNDCFSSIQVLCPYFQVSSSNTSSNTMQGVSYTSLCLIMSVVDIPPQDDDILLLKLEVYAMPLQQREIEYSLLY